MAYFSIIAPIYNKKNTLQSFIREIMEQSYKDFELILVDDASNDGSDEIIREWMKLDKRVIGIFQEANQGILSARKRGFFEATGEYIWFMDPDDSIAFPGTLETLREQIEINKVDIFQFGTDVEIHCDMNPVDRKNLLKSVKAYSGRLDGEQIFKEGFINKSYSFHIWNRICSKSIWQRVFEIIPDIRAMMSEDFLTTFILSYIAKTYYGTNKIFGYRYRFGNGVSASNSMNIAKMSNRSTQAIVIDTLKKCMETLAPTDTDVQEVLKSYEEKMIVDSLYVWFHFCSADDSKKAFEILCSTWNLNRIFPILIRDYWENKKELIKRTSGYLPDCAANSIKTIGVYYFRMRNGGVEKVISLLIPMWLSKGYKVVLITDEPQSDEDYDVPDNVSRVVINKCELKDKNGFIKRTEQIRQAIKEYSIDAVVYHAWNDLNLFWDMRAVQSAGARFYVQTHLVFSSTISWLGESWNYINYELASADGVITITTTDYKYWSIYNKNAVKISNPIDKALITNEIVDCDNHNIIWIARFEDYKRPKDVFPIMKKVVSVVPDAKLIMLGTAENQKELEIYKELSENNGLNDVIEFAGFHKDISEYYRKSRIHLLTSEMEGFSMVLLESKSYGIPTVMYNLDYLDMVRDGRGILTSSIGDTSTLADHIIDLLQDDSLWIKESKMARESFDEFSREKLADEWDDYFKRPIQVNDESDLFSDTSIARTIMNQINDEVWKRENSLLYGNEIGTKEAMKIAAKRIIKKVKKYRNGSYE